MSRYQDIASTSRSSLRRVRAMSTTAVPSSDDEQPLLDSSGTSSSSEDPSPLLSSVPLRRSVTNDGINEHTSLLSMASVSRSYSSIPRNSISRSWMPGTRTPGGARTPRNQHHPRMPSVSWGAKLASAMQSSWHAGRNSLDQSTSTLKPPVLWDERVWYDQYTSTDWVHDSIADNFRLRDLELRKGIRGRFMRLFDGSQGWILAAIIGIVIASIAYVVDLSEDAIFDMKEGYCVDGWHKSKGNCCLNEDDCPLWVTWGGLLEFHGFERKTIDLFFYVLFVVVFSVASCLLTLTTKTVVASNVTLPTMDENLGADVRQTSPDGRDTTSRKPAFQPTPGHTIGKASPTMTYYPASGSGVAEVKVILSGFVLHGYLGFRTLFVKTVALVLSVSSGMSLGKEGPYVHIATCVGNIACRLFTKYRDNDGKRREVLSASAASGVAVAFGAPLAGTLFSLEEVSYYFPPKTLFRTFFCCIAAALSLKFLNPYGTGKIVIFEVRYFTDWNVFEMVGFIVLGFLGGALGALFIKASRLWARSFRRISVIKRMPVLEVAIVALITGLIQFWNKHTKSSVTTLLSELASPCNKDTANPSSLCPTTEAEFRDTALTLAYAFVIKAFLTTITFGIKVPAGIYVPSMVVGGIMGRLFGHGLQYLVLQHPSNPIWATCSQEVGPEACITPGVYALVAAGATMCGVTRLSVTLTVILFELTGSLDHVLPFSLSVLVAKWTADALEPLSIYDLLTEMNRYPYLDSKTHPTFTSELGDITPKHRSKRVIDISRSSKVPVSKLKKKLTFLRSAGEIDGGLPIIRDGALVGLLPGPDLEFALDRLSQEFNLGSSISSVIPVKSGDENANSNSVEPVSGREVYCLMSLEEPLVSWSDEEDYITGEGPRVFDLTGYIDPAPVALDVHSPMDLVYQCFVKLGLRYICVLRDGQYTGLIHKKAFVKYIRDLESGKEI